MSGRALLLALCAFVADISAAEFPAVGNDLIRWCAPTASRADKQTCHIYLDALLGVHMWRVEKLREGATPLWCFPQNITLDELGLVVHRHIYGLKPDVQKQWALPTVEAAFMRNFPCPSK